MKIIVLLLILVYQLNCPCYGFKWKGLESDDYSDGLPFWYEKRPDLQPTNYMSRYADIDDAIETRKNMELGELSNILNDLDEVPIRQPHYQNLHRLRRDPSSERPLTLNLRNGLRSGFNWQPAVIGSVCAVIGILVIAGTATLYQRHRQSKEYQGGNIKLRNILHGNDRHPQITSTDGDRKLAQSAQMYHYQHQKQQMLAMEKTSDHSQLSEDEDSVGVQEADFTVYECPISSNNGAIEVENPLFDNEQTMNTSGSFGELIGVSDIDEQTNLDESPDSLNQSIIVNEQTTSHL